MILELSNIYKTYQQDALEVPVLKDVSLSVDKGDYLAIQGPSGSGKSTLMNIVGCLDLPTEGKYLLDGIDVVITLCPRFAATKSDSYSRAISCFRVRQPCIMLCYRCLLPEYRAPSGGQSQRKH